MIGRGSAARGGLLAVTAAALLLAGCVGAPQAGAAKPAPAEQGSSAKPAAGGSASGDVDNGKQLFAAKGCIACHVAPGVPGASGTIGPNLTGIGNQSRRPQLAGSLPNNTENLKRWVKDPQAVKSGTMMPNLNLSDKEADDLVAFLETLK